MSCDNVRQRLSAFADDALDADTARAVRDHLVRCPACRNELARLRRLNDLVGTLEPLRLGDDFAERVTRIATRPVPVWRRVAMTGAVAASLLVGAVLGISMARDMVSADPAPEVSGESAAAQPAVWLADPPGELPSVVDALHTDLSAL